MRNQDREKMGIHQQRREGKTRARTNKSPDNPGLTESTFLLLKAGSAYYLSEFRLQLFLQPLYFCLNLSSKVA
jgi:hypothetical protein